VCQGQEAPVEIASGGRYDALVGRFCQDPAQAAGVGFGFDIEAVRELVAPTLGASMPVLVAYGRAEDLATALDQLEALHQAGTAAELLSGPTASQAEAQAIGEARGCSRTVWITP
jgi:ATP phosphoribosyltransferase regulatory subunit